MAALRSSAAGQTVALPSEVGPDANGRGPATRRDPGTDGTPGFGRPVRRPCRMTLMSLARLLRPRRLGLPLIGAALTLLGCQDAPSQAAPPAASGARPAQARAVKVTPATEQTTDQRVSATGTLAADEQVVLGTKVAGRVAELPVDLGSRAPARPGRGAPRSHRRPAPRRSIRGRAAAGARPARALARGHRRPRGRRAHRPRQAGARRARRGQAHARAHRSGSSSRD